MSVAKLQDNLRAKGFDPGVTDGALGAFTYQALAQYLNDGKAPKDVGTHLALHLRNGQINTRLRVIHFFAQVSHESGFRPISENLNYATPRLMSLFSRARISEADCRRHGRGDGRQANPEAIANCVYGGEWGRRNLGNTEPGDGWRFRGRGLIQLTGRANYRRTGPEYEINPDLVLTPSGSVKAAVDYWRTRGLNPLADADDLEAVTRRINGGTIGLDHRRELTNKAKAIWPA
jgi:putative chitinase